MYPISSKISRQSVTIIGKKARKHLNCSIQLLEELLTPTWTCTYLCSSNGNKMLPYLYTHTAACPLASFGPPIKGASLPPLLLECVHTSFFEILITTSTAEFWTNGFFSFGLLQKFTCIFMRNLANRELRIGIKRVPII